MEEGKNCWFSREMLSEEYAGSLCELTGLENSWNFISPLILGGVTLTLIVLDFWKLFIFIVTPRMLSSYSINTPTNALI